MEKKFILFILVEIWPYIFVIRISDKVEGRIAPPLMETEIRLTPPGLFN